MKKLFQKKVKRLMLHWGAVWLLIFMFSSNGFASEELTSSLNLRSDTIAILPEETKFVDVSVEGTTSQEGFHLLLILVLGEGDIEIGMEKSDVAGQVVVMTGIAISASGITPIFKTGITKDAISASASIGIGGLVIIFSGVVYSPDSIEEEEYSFEVSLTPPE